MVKKSTPDENKVLIDTNLLLDDAKILYKLSNEFDKVIIPLTVLKELDDHKFKPFTAFSAREAIRAIREFEQLFENKIIFDTVEGDSTKSNDQKIIESAIRNQATIASKDMSMMIIAKSLGLKTRLFDLVMNNIFNPYVYIEQSDIFDVSEDDTFAYVNTYNKNEYHKVFKLFSAASKKELNKDAWFFVFINTITPDPIVYAHNPISPTFSRIDNMAKYREISIDKHTKLKMLDLYQTCALYAMTEAPNTLICGSYGSGKSLIATAYALATNDRKTFLSRPNLTIDKRYDIGFLPGQLSDKLMPWVAGITSSLYHLFSNTRTLTTDKMLDNSNTYDYVKDHIFTKHFDLLPLDSLQGMSFLNEDLVILDETQLCSISILSLILSRFGIGSKLISLGDVKQIYGVLPPSENGLLKLLRLMPNKNMAYVELKNHYRGGLVELADGLQNKTII